MTNYDVEIELEKNKSTSKKLRELKRRKFMMKSLISLKLLYPYLLDTGIILGVFSLIGATPFYRESHSTSLQTKRTIDSLGNDKSVSLYIDKHQGNEGLLTYYSSWTKNDNDYYERDVKKYNIRNINHYVIEQLVTKSETISNLEDIFGESVIEGTEVKEYVPVEELNTPPYIEATLYSRDDNSVMKIRESAESNLNESITIILCILASYSLINVNKKGNGGYKASDARIDKDKIDLEYANKVNSLARRLKNKNNSKK